MKLAIIIMIFLISANLCQTQIDCSSKDFINVYGITLEETTINDALTILGSTRQYQDGDAAYSSHRIN